jgi:acyl-CoA thioesterase-1
MDFSMGRDAPAAAFIAAMSIATPTIAPAQAPGSLSAAESCLAANRGISLGSRLPRTATRLKAGGPLKIVAVGSSSTTGLWMLTAAATYPDVLRRELGRLQPNAQVAVVNAGRIGDTIPGTLARLDRDVVAAEPDLVVWQLGTNDVAWGGRTDGLKEQIILGVRRLKSTGADVILMDMQYAPIARASSHYAAMLAIIADAARQERIGLFSRSSLMQRSIDAGLPAGALVSWDGLHNSSDGYDCMGRALARAIHAAAR